MSYLMCRAIRWYQRYISVLRGRRCKYYPTCSSYALQALQTHGAPKGIILSIWRLLRCNPLSDGGVDYPPLKGQWQAAPYHQMTNEELRQHWDRLDAELAQSKEQTNAVV